LIDKEKNLAYKFPKLAEEWHPVKNGNLTPSDFTFGSNKMVWWIGKCGHEWDDTIQHRVAGRKCPFCAGRRVLKGFNDLGTLYPQIANEWHPIKNGELTPSDVTYGSGKKVWWVGICEHEWDSTIKERVRGYGCPICAGKRVYTGINDLENKFPEIALEWAFDKNSPLLPNQVSSRSHKKVWWNCKNGHQYQSSIDNRTRGRNCPFCNHKTIIVNQNDLQSQNPFLALEYSTRNAISAASIFINSHKKVWWTCSICKNEWEATVDSRNRGNGCPACALRAQSSFPEQAIFYYVKQTCPDALNRCTSVLDNRMELDIYIPSQKIGIEYDGQHWHDDPQVSKREQVKFSICKQQGIFLIRISDKKISDLPNCNYSISTEKGIDNAIRELERFIPIPSNINCDKDRLKITEKYIHTQKENSFLNKRPDIATEWHSQKNGNLTPDMFSEFSMLKVWWKCQKGHEWQSTIAHRTKMGANCPYCSNRKVLKGYNDIATTHPNFLDEWDFEKNLYLPSELTAGSKKKVWWKCKKCGHSWETPVYRRKTNCNCPICKKQ
jgi:DNA-directed RNA polymerase subunit RPC12/RpoP